jgi:hypothetical protein
LIFKGKMTKKSLTEHFASGSLRTLILVLVLVLALPELRAPSGGEGGKREKEKGTIGE